MTGFGAHYKGDVSEVTMGHETGLIIEHGEPRTFTAITAAAQEYTTIEFRGTDTVAPSGYTNSSIFEQTLPKLKVPLGMLIGQKLSFHAITPATGSSSNNFSAHYYNSLQSKLYTIVDHTLENNTDSPVASATVLKIVPALPTGTINSSAGDSIFIHSHGLPTLQGDNNSVMNTAAASSKEVSLIDGFVGLASFMTLPDTTVDLHSYHVVGLGRQVAVQQTGKVHHMGGSIEMPMHNAKWLYYSLGREVVDKDQCGDIDYDAGVATCNIYADVSPGQGYIDLASTQSSALRFGSSDDASVGDYILLKDTTLVQTTTYKTPSKGTASTQYWPPDVAGESSTSTLGSDANHFEWAESSECRRISGIQFLATLGSGSHPHIFRVYVDDGWQFSHTTSDTVELRYYDDGVLNSSPHVRTDRNIQNPVHRLLFSGETVPSFCMEHSIRTRDVGSFNASSESVVSPGSTGDSKQLTRIFKGCKVVEWEISSTVDAELKYRCVFDALACYTDTGRLESTNKGDRYTAHRMFQNTADTLKGRKASGIAEGSEKPFMFYNGTISAFGQDIGFISKFELRGKTGVELFHTIQGNPIQESVTSTNLSLKQVPYGGTRNASIIREGREEFEMEIVVALENATLFHELRSHVQRSGTVGTAAGLTTDDPQRSPFISLRFTKPVTTSGTGQTPSLRILIDDYYITEMPIPMPDDKGLLFTSIKLKPQNVKVISMDADYHC